MQRWTAVTIIAFGITVLATTLEFSAARAYAEPTTYTDPRGRFTLAHDSSDWRVMPNFAGGAELFCLAGPCRTGGAQCTLSMAASESDAATEGEDSSETVAALMLAAMMQAQATSVGPVTTDVPSEPRRRRIGDVTWHSLRFGVTLFGRFRRETTLWFALGRGSTTLLQCHSAEAAASMLDREVETLLAGFRLDTP